MGPPIQIFLTSIASAPALRQRQEHLLRILQVKKIPFTSYDLASDEEAKKLWRRKAPPNNISLPGILVGGEFVGAYNEFEEAVEFGELDQFFKLNEPWGEEDEALAPAPSPQKPIGVPGVATPSQITGQKPSFSPSPSRPLKKSSDRTKSIDIGTELGFGLEGVKVSEEDMRELVESLGLGGEDADDLVKGLGLTSSKTKSEKAAAPIPEVPTPKAKAITDASETAGSSNVTAVAPSDTKITSSTGQASEAPQPPSAPETKEPTTKTAAPDVAPQANTTAKDLPTSETSPKVPQADIPESVSAVALPNNDTQLPSATNDVKSVVHPPPQDNTSTNVSPEDKAEPKEES